MIFLSFFVKKHAKLLIFGVSLYQLLFIIIFHANVRFNINILNLIGGLGIGFTSFYLESLINFTKNSLNSENKTISKQWLILIFISPIIEEIFYRTLIFQFLENLLTDANTSINFLPVYLILSALVVVSGHFQIWLNKKYFLQKLLVEGIYLSFIYYSFKSIFLNIVAHIFFNIITYVKYFRLEGLQSKERKQ